jgi:hypothetical protein
MKKLIFNKTTIILVLLLSTVWCGNLFANNDDDLPIPLKEEANKPNRLKKIEFSKEIKKEFPISANGDVRITNKYGNVNITTSTENEVKFTISIKIKAEDKHQAEEAFNYLKVEFENTPSSVDAQTVFLENTKNNWKVWKNLSYEIHYEVSLPSTVNLNIYNKYGNTYMGDMKGTVTLDLKYGNLKTGDIAKDLKLEIGYGKADLGNIQDADVSIKYSKLDIENMKNLNINSKYSHMYIDKANQIKSETTYDKYYLGEVNTLRNYGRYDDFEIQQVNDIDVIGKFSDFDIKKLNGTAEFQMNYGDANIHGANGFNSIVFTGKHADLLIDLGGAGAKIDGRGEHANLKMPSTMKKTHEETRGESTEIAGTVNGGGNLIKMTVEYGNVIIYQ